jgi:hypothetical protein
MLRRVLVVAAAVASAQVRDAQGARDLPGA